MSLVYVGKQRLFGEVVSSAGEESIVQIYEDSGGLAAGEPVYPTNEPMSIRLGPGLIGGIFDGIGRPLQIIEAMAGSFIAKGINIESLDETKNGPVTMLVKEGDELSPRPVRRLLPRERDDRTPLHGAARGLRPGRGREALRRVHGDGAAPLR